MSCHNAYPEFTLASENKYERIPNGIDCERCHGPGSIHVQQKAMGIKVDTATAIDYSIVNPAKLSIDLQFDVCQRCHLQGNAVLKEGRSFYDFKPGKKLSDVFTVFMPKYEGADKEFIMASHPDRLQMSECFIKSYKPEESKKSLRPYKEALTCVTCHDPHVSVKFTGKEVFNKACMNCHGGKNNVLCSEKPEVRKKVSDDCVSCHMPKSGSIDIPHVSVTDHFIRKPMPVGEVAKVKKFIGLYAINEKNPSSKTKAEAYINQLEKFDLANYFLLDSALKYLPDVTVNDVQGNFDLLVRVYYLKGDYKKIIGYAEKIGREKLLKEILDHKSWDNRDAWTCYRIGESYFNKQPMEGGEVSAAFSYYDKAVALAPGNYEFRNKLGSALFKLGKKPEAKKIFEAIVKENPKFASAAGNLGYSFFAEDNYRSALVWYNKALALDPDYSLALLNKTSALIMMKNDEEAKKTLKRYLALNAGTGDLNEAFASLKKFLSTSVKK